jgi:uncharacterized membrane protein YgcG
LECVDSSCPGGSACKGNHPPTADALTHMLNATSKWVIVQSGSMCKGIGNLQLNGPPPLEWASRYLPLLQGDFKPTSGVDLSEVRRLFKNSQKDKKGKKGGKSGMGGKGGKGTSGGSRGSAK